MSVSMCMQRIACVQVQVCACTFIDDHVCLHLFIEPCVTPLTPAVLTGVLPLEWPDDTDQMTLSELSRTGTHRAQESRTFLSFLPGCSLSPKTRQGRAEFLSCERVCWMGSEGEVRGPSRADSGDPYWSGWESQQTEGKLVLQL